MEQYIDKTAVVAEIKKRKKEWQYGSSIEAKYKKEECDDILSFLDTLEVKDVDLEKELNTLDNIYFELNGIAIKGASNYLVVEQLKEIAKHFFELGLKVNCPITASDRGMAEEIIINLKRVENDYRIDLTKEIEWLRNKTKKGEQL